MNFITGVSAANSGSDNFMINIQVIKPISIAVEENIDFGKVEQGSGSQTATTEAIISGETGLQYTVNFENNGLVQLTNAVNNDHINVFLEYLNEDSENIIKGEKDIIQISAFIDETEIENIEPEKYSGSATITVQYAD